VLPALGEVDVRQVTIDDLVSNVEVSATDPPGTAAVKHDARMAVVLHNALWYEVREPTEPLVVPDGSNRWRIGVPALTRIVAETRAEAVPYAAGRGRVLARVVGLLQRQAELRRAESPGDARLRRMARSRPVTGFLDTVWPQWTPERLVFRLLAEPERLAAAADGVLDPAEQRLLAWPRPPRSAKAVRWSAADALLIDEATGLIERTSSVGHVVVDEAQDLSPMQLRAIARRTSHGSITLLGDLAQGTAPWAATNWRQVTDRIGKPEAAVVPLTTGFRVPAAVLALANRLLPALRVEVPAAVSLRRDGRLDLRHTGDLAAATVAEVRAALGFEGSIAVIAADSLAGRLREALAAADVSTADAEDPGGRVTVLPATIAKGLEYDHVIVVEPAAIVAAEPRGLHRLYVVLTRAVSRLVVLHSEPLPAPLTG
jgi:hypothetical protein